MCFDFLYNNVFLTYFLFYELLRESWSTMCIGLHTKYPLFSTDFDETWISSTDFSKNTQMTNFMKILPVGAELFHADGWTDMTKLIVAFRILRTRLKTSDTRHKMFNTTINYKRVHKNECTTHISINPILTLLSTKQSEWQSNKPQTITLEWFILNLPSSCTVQSTYTVTRS